MARLPFNVKRSDPELVVPERPIPREIKQLSDIDEQKGLHFLVPFIFFYPPAEGEVQLEDPVKIIKNGLAKALVFYYPMAGIIFEGDNQKLMVDCNNQGVEFVEADADVKLEQLGDEILPPCPHMEKLMCTLPESGGIFGFPLLRFQVTRFSCGGFSLGIWLNHMIADGYGLMLFLSTVTELLKGAFTPTVSPAWQRHLLSARFPPRITCTHYEFEQHIPDNTNSSTSPHDNLVLTSISVGPKELQALRNQIPQNQTPKRPTRFELITACLWICRTIALEPNPEDITRVSMLMNVRQEKNLGLPNGYYGNAIVYPAALCRVRDLSGNPLSYAVNLIQQAKMQMNDEYVKSVADLMVIKGRPLYVTRLNFIFSDLTRLGFDKADFGWGEPLYGGVPRATPVISFYSSLKNIKGGEGVIVPVYLPSSALEKFRDELDKMIGGKNLIGYDDVVVL